MIPRASKRLIPVIGDGGLNILVPHVSAEFDKYRHASNASLVRNKGTLLIHLHHITDRNKGSK